MLEPVSLRFQRIHLLCFFEINCYSVYRRHLRDEDARVLRLTRSPRGHGARVFLRTVHTPVSDPKIGHQPVINEELDLGITVEDKPKTDTKPVVNQTDQTKGDLQTKPATEKPTPNVRLTPPPLLILDLNGCLLKRKHVAGKGKRVVPRPHLDQLFDYVLGAHPDHADQPFSSMYRNWEVLIWSSAQPQNVRSMCEAIKVSKRPVEAPMKSRSRILQADSSQLRDISNRLNSLGINEPPLQDLKAPESPGHGPHQVLDIWSRSMLDLSFEEYNRKVQTTKDLRKVWDRVAWFNPLTGEEVKWGPHNTVIVDDSPDKLFLQPDNLYVIPEFTGNRDDEAILDLVEKLKTLQSEPDMPTALKKLK